MRPRGISRPSRARRFPEDRRRAGTGAPAVAISRRGDGYEKLTAKSHLANRAVTGRVLSRNRPGSRSSISAASEGRQRRAGTELSETQREGNGWSLPAARRRAILGLAALRDPNPDHGQHVARLALRLFDSAKRAHGLGAAERRPAS